jgi:hypothetical protein
MGSLADVSLVLGSSVVIPRLVALDKAMPGFSVAWTAKNDSICGCLLA